MQTRWTNSADSDDPRYQYRDRTCWIDAQSRTLLLEEFLVSPHDDFEKTQSLRWPIKDFLARTALQEQVREWFGDAALGQALAASSAMFPDE